MITYWGSGGIGPHILRGWMEVSVQLHAQASLPPVAIGQETGWASELVLMRRQTPVVQLITYGVSNCF